MSDDAHRNTAAPETPAAPGPAPEQAAPQTEQQQEQTRRAPRDDPGPAKPRPERYQVPPARANFDAIVENYERGGGPDGRPPIEETTEQQAAPETPVQQPEQTGAVAGDDMLVEIVVDGVTQKVKVGDLRRTVQKETAADRRLKDAAEERKRLEQRARDLDEREKAIAPRPQGTQAPSDDAAPDQLSDIIRTLRYGSDEEAEDAGQQLVEVAAKRRDSQIPISQVAQQAAAIISHSTEQRAAVQEVAQQYPNIIADPNLLRMSSQNYVAIMTEDQQAGRQRAHREVILEAAARTQSWVDKITGTSKATTPKPASQALDQRRDLKRQTPQPPATTSLRSPAPVPDRPQTPSEIVADMRKTRGLPAL